MKYKYNGQWYDLTIKALDGMPLGSGIEYFGTLNNIPTGWLVRDGSAISRTEYSELFAIIGTTYGTGDGSTTFNLPNDCGRIDVGYDSSDTDFNTIGKTGGSKYLQEHKHSFSVTKTGVMQYAYPGPADIPWNFSSNGEMKSADLNISGETSKTGTGNSGNLQPYLVCLKLIKAKNTTPTMASIVDAYSASAQDGYSCNYVNNNFGGKVEYYALDTNIIPTKDCYAEVQVGCMGWGYDGQLTILGISKQGSPTTIIESLGTVEGSNTTYRTVDSFGVYELTAGNTYKFNCGALSGKTEGQHGYVKIIYK